jgi:hypothetical protein
MLEISQPEVQRKVIFRQLHPIDAKRPPDRAAVCFAGAALQLMTTADSSIDFEAL